MATLTGINGRLEIVSGDSCGGVISSFDPCYVDAYDIMEFGGALPVIPVKCTYSVWEDNDNEVVNPSYLAKFSDGGVVTVQNYIICPYCGKVNPPDGMVCGRGEWDGCGAPLVKQ